MGMEPMLKPLIGVPAFLITVYWIIQLLPEDVQNNLPDIVRQPSTILSTELVKALENLKDANNNVYPEKYKNDQVEDDAEKDLSASSSEEESPVEGEYEQGQSAPTPDTKQSLRKKISNKVKYLTTRKKKVIPPAGGRTVPRQSSGPVDTTVGSQVGTPEQSYSETADELDNQSTRDDPEGPQNTDSVTAATDGEGRLSGRTHLPQPAAKTPDKVKKKHHRPHLSSITKVHIPKVHIPNGLAGLMRSKKASPKNKGVEAAGDQT